MTQKEREHRIIARGEHSNHVHIATGDVGVVKEGYFKEPIKET